MILSEGCFKSQIEEAWAELGFCSTLLVFRHVPYGRPWDMLSLWWQLCFTQPLGLLYVPHTLNVRATMVLHNLVIDLKIQDWDGKWRNKNFSESFEANTSGEAPGLPSNLPKDSLCPGVLGSPLRDDFSSQICSLTCVTKQVESSNVPTSICLQAG